MLKSKPFLVQAEWDGEAQVWVATSDDVPGLATEGNTLEGLIERLKILIPELLEANESDGSREITFELCTRRFEVAHRAGA